MSYHKVEEIDFVKLEREMFERWAQSQGFHISKRIHKEYENSKLQWMWRAWYESASIHKY